MKLVFSDIAWRHYLSWQESDPNVLDRLNSLIKECQRTPFTGTGRPEPLKQDFKGWWSRRITLEHRLIYRVVGSGEDQALEIARCRSHYRD